MERLAFLFPLVFLGCSAHGHQHAVKTPTVKDWAPSKRCRTIAKVRTANVAVMVERNCFRNGVTTVGMVTLNNRGNGDVAARDAVILVKNALGFTPRLTALFYGKTHGKLFILAAVTGAVEPSLVAASTDK